MNSKPWTNLVYDNFCVFRLMISKFCQRQIFRCEKSPCRSINRAEAARKQAHKNSLTMWAVINFIYRNSTVLWLNWQTDVIQLLQIQMMIFGQRHLPFFTALGVVIVLIHLYMVFAPRDLDIFPVCSTRCVLFTPASGRCVVIYVESVLTHTKCTFPLVSPSWWILNKEA